jgi:hypothetical protein
MSKTRHGSEHTSGNRLRELLLQSLASNMVGLLVGTLLGGGVMFFVQRSVNAGDAARKEVVGELIPKLEKVHRALTPLDWDTMMSMDDQTRTQRFQTALKASVANWDSLYEGYDLTDLKLKFSFGDKAAADFSKIVNDFGDFVQAADPAKEDKRIGNKDLLLADTSAYNLFAGLAGKAGDVGMEIYEFEISLLKR